MATWSPTTDDFATELHARGVRYVLPRRRLEQMSKIGWALMVFGGFGTAFMIFWMSTPIGWGIRELNRGQPFGWAMIVFGCLGIFGLVPALGMLMGGLAVITHRTQCLVEVRDGRLVVREKLLLFTWKRKKNASEIQRLRIVSASESLPDRRGKRRPEDVVHWLGDSGAALIAESDGNRKFPVAVAYPREMLRKLAEELAPRLDAVVDSSLQQISRGVDAMHATASPATVSILEGDDQREIPTPPRQPADSRSSLERRPDGITIHIPPAGLWKGSKGLILFALFWNAFVGLFIVVAVLGSLGIIKADGDGPGWVLILFLIPFMAVGVGMLLLAINMGRRYASIATSDDLVFVVSHSIFGKRQREWSVPDLESIDCGPSGMEVNGVPVLELQFHSNDGRKFGCLSQLDEDELRWIAAELHESLGIPGQAAE